MDWIPYVINGEFIKDIKSKISDAIINSSSIGEVVNLTKDIRNEGAQSVLFKKIYESYFDRFLFNEGDIENKTYADIPIIPDKARKYDDSIVIDIRNTVHRSIYKLASLEPSSIEMACQPLNDNHEVFMRMIILVAKYYNHMDENNIRIFFEGDTIGDQSFTRAFSSGTSPAFTPFIFNNLYSLNVLAINLFFSNHSKGIFHELGKSCENIGGNENINAKYIPESANTDWYAKYAETVGFFDARTILMMLNIFNENHKFLYKNESYFNIMMTLRKSLVFTNDNFFNQFLLIHFIKSQIPAQYSINYYYNITRIFSYYPWNPYNKAITDSRKIKPLSLASNFTKIRLNISSIKQTQNIIMTHVIPFLIFSGHTVFTNAAISQYQDLVSNLYKADTLIDTLEHDTPLEMTFENFNADANITASIKRATFNCMLFTIKILLRFIHLDTMPEILVIKLKCPIIIRLDNILQKLYYYPFIVSYTGAQILKDTFAMIVENMKQVRNFDAMNKVILNSLIKQNTLFSTVYSKINVDMLVANESNTKYNLFLPDCKYIVETVDDIEIYEPINIFMRPPFHSEIRALNDIMLIRGDENVMLQNNSTLFMELRTIEYYYNIFKSESKTLVSWYSSSSAEGLTSSMKEIAEHILNNVDVWFQQMIQAEIALINKFRTVYPENLILDDKYVLWHNHVIEYYHTYFDFISGTSLDKYIHRVMEMEARINSNKLVQNLSNYVSGSSVETKGHEDIFPSNDVPIIILNSKLNTIDFDYSNMVEAQYKILYAGNRYIQSTFRNTARYYLDLHVDLAVYLNRQFDYNTTCSESWVRK